MQIRVLFFGILKDVTGLSPLDTANLPEQSTLTDLLNHYAASKPGLCAHFDGIAMSINRSSPGRRTCLKPETKSLCFRLSPVARMHLPAAPIAPLSVTQSIPQPSPTFSSRPEDGRHRHL